MVEPWMDFFFQAMGQLKHDANHHGVIPWSVIKSFAETWGLDTNEFTRLHDNIRAMEKGLSDEMAKEKKSKPVKNEEAKNQ